MSYRSDAEWSKNNKSNHCLWFHLSYWMRVQKGTGFNCLHSYRFMNKNFYLFLFNSPFTIHPPLQSFQFSTLYANRCSCFETSIDGIHGVLENNAFSNVEIRDQKSDYDAHTFSRGLHFQVIPHSIEVKNKIKKQKEQKTKNMEKKRNFVYENW